MSAGTHLDDEQLTALHDGDGTADERAHLDTCGRCTERADALAGVAALVAAPPPPPADDARDAAVGSALEEADRPAHLRGPRRGVPSWVLPAAAVVAFFALVAGLIPLLEGGSSDDDASRQAGGAAEPSGGDSEESADQALRGGALAALPDLGTVDDEAELARRVGDALGSTEAADAAAPSTAERCVASFRTTGSVLGPLRLRASLTWRDQPAEVLSDGDRAYVVAAGGCTTLAVVDLP